MKREREYDEYTYHKPTRMVSWRKDDDKHPPSECACCGEAVRDGSPFCSLFCRIEYHQQAA